MGIKYNFDFFNTKSKINCEKEKIITLFNNIQFKQKPNLKYKCDINNHIYDSRGKNDRFEVFKSYKDNKVYIASPNERNNIDIISLINNKIIISLSNHKYFIETIKYSINNKNNNEYLISGDFCTIIIWDISNKYKIIHKIYFDNSSCLLTFINDNNFIITSTKITSVFKEETATEYIHLIMEN